MTVILLILLLLNMPKTVDAQVINEFLVGPNPEWVEIYNASNSAEYLKSYWIDDDEQFGGETGRKITKLSSLNTDSINYPYIELSSFLNNDGDYVALFDSGGSLIDSYQYTNNPGSGITIGRSPDSSGSFQALQSATKGSVNASPIPTSTPTPTKTPTPTNTPKPTKIPTPSPTTKPVKTPTPTISIVITQILTPSRITAGETNTGSEREKDVLGLRKEIGDKGGTENGLDEGEEKEKKFPLTAAAFILGGLSFVGAGIFPYTKKWYLKKRGISKGSGNDRITL